MQNPTRHTEETIDTEKKVHQKFHSDAHHSLCLAAKWNEDFVSLTKCSAQNMILFYWEWQINSWQWQINKFLENFSHVSHNNGVEISEQDSFWRKLFLTCTENSEYWIGLIN